MKKNKTIIHVPIKVELNSEGTNFIAYSKKYDITGYGDTIPNAVESLVISVKEILLYTKPKKTKQ